MRRFLFALGVVSVLGHALPALADDTSELEGLLETSVVSAPSKTAETVNVAPATSIVMTVEDLRRYGIRTIDEAINFLAFGMVAERRFQTTEVGARGVHLVSDFGSHVLLVVDGHVLNEQWGATAYFDRGTAIPFEIIDHIELVLGPGSVLYGSNAMLGIVHIVTKRAKDYKGAHVVVESEVPVSIRGAAGIGKEFELFGSQGELVFEAEYYRQDGPVYDFGPQDYGADAVSGVPRHFDPNPTDRRYPAGVWGGRGDDAHYAHIPSAYLRLRLGQFELGARAALFERTDPTDGGNFDDPNSYEVDRWVHVDLKHTVAMSAAVKLTTRLYADAYDYNQYWTSNGAEDCLEGQDAGCLWQLNGQAKSVGLEPQLTLDWFEDGRAVMLVGIDGRIKQLKSQVDYFDNVTGESPGAIGAYDPTEYSLAAYVQQTFWATKGLALNAGARLDIDDRFGSHGSPRAAIAVLPWQGGTAKLMYAEAFRAPTAFDIYYHDPTTQIPGGDLEPEVVRSVETSFEQRFGTRVIQVGLFHSWWQDLLLSEDLTQAEIDAAIDRGELEPLSTYGAQVRNVESIKSFGMNLAYDGSLQVGRLRYGASVTQAFARRDDQDSTTESTELAVAPTMFANARISYDLSNGLPTLGFAMRWITRRPADDYPEGGHARPNVELRAAVSGPIAAGFSYRATANYQTAESGAYSVRGNVLPNGERERNPYDQFRVGVGLGWDLPL
jgi:outer membrane receptor for ferrienterochelin and colicins